MALCTTYINLNLSANQSCGQPNPFKMENGKEVVALANSCRQHRGCVEALLLLTESNIFSALALCDTLP